MAEPSAYSDPRTPTADELPAVVALANRVFRTNRPGDMGVEYPLLFDADRLEQIRIIDRAGEPVALVGMLTRETAALGCRFDVACIGSVGCDEPHRGQGLASRLMNDQIARAVDAGAAVMMISGGRGLYLRLGATPVGRFVDYELTADRLPMADDVTAEPVPPEPGPIEAARRLLETRGIRFVLEADDLTRQLGSGYVADRAGGCFVVRRGGRPTAVVAATFGEEERGGNIRVVEYAGSATTMLEGLAALARDRHAADVAVQGDLRDIALADACARCRAAAAPRPLKGTVKLLNADRLWQACRPLIRERVGRDLGDELTLEATQDRTGVQEIRFRLGGEQFKVVGPDAAALALFGHPEQDPLATVDGRLGDALRTALPLPLADYGMAYV